MKLLRNSLFAFYMDYQISLKLNPVLTVLGTATVAAFTAWLVTLFCAL
ncbi:hypothetical protein EJP02_178 [Escherichia phage EJP2]|nr:hypothetical protein EJP02_178 [Escherichia phage EJP2]